MSWCDADLPYSTSERILLENFSNFGQIAEGNCFFLVYHGTYTITCSLILIGTQYSGSWTSQGQNDKKAKRVCLHPIYQSRRCYACHRKHGSSGAPLFNIWILRKIIIIINLIRRTHPFFLLSESWWEANFCRNSQTGERGFRRISENFWSSKTTSAAFARTRGSGRLLVLKINFRKHNRFSNEQLWNITIKLDFTIWSMLF